MGFGILKGKEEMSQLDEVERHEAESEVLHDFSEEHDHAQHEHHKFQNSIFYTSNIGSLVAAVYPIITHANVRVFNIEPDL